MHGVFSYTYRSSDDNVRATYELVMANMAKKHAEIRLSAFQIVAEIFPRSHIFRQLMISDFQQLTRLVIGIEAKHPLPPPRPAAKRLKESSLLAIRQWQAKFGDAYPKLKIAFNHLKHNKKARSYTWPVMLAFLTYCITAPQHLCFSIYLQVDFDNLVAETESVRRQNEERESRRAVIARQRLLEVHSEMAGKSNTYMYGQFCCLHTCVLHCTDSSVVHGESF